ncbi:MAG TPA: hypothetical protein VM597_36445 [Gemmataceae bacterium]|nr:hypothetical protein [Gemmataceae bacterium]
MKASLTAVALLACPPVFGGEWTKLAPLPDREGVAGPFAGVSNGALLVAGGANFPDRKPWDGGKKVWHDTVYALDKPTGAWKVAGKLPRPLAYGVCVSHGPGVVCVGGSDPDRHYPDAFRLEWADGKLVTTPLPSLPQPLANACGALVGDTLYVCGGQVKPDAEATPAAWRLDLAAREPAWREIEACPGRGRMLAIAAGIDGAFWVFGGVELVAGKEKPERRYLSDAYRYDARKGWTRVADLPRPLAAAPSPAPTDAGGFYLLGGDDGSQIGTAPERHPGFNRKVLRYDLASAKWSDGGTVEAPRVTVPCVRWERWWVVPSGEVRPGARSPDVWAWTAP